MLLAEVVETSRRVAETRSRLRKFELLSVCVERLAPHECEAGVAFLSGELRQGKIGVGYRSVSKLGGEGAATAASLDLSEVDRVFSEVARRSGAGSSVERQRLLGDLMRRATAEEQAFLKRLLIGELRQGALEGVLVEAVARAFRVSPKALRRAVMLSGALESVVRALLSDGPNALSQFKLELFRPIQPMLAGTAQGVGPALAELGEAALEYKLDGARVQVHRAGEEVRVYTRALNEVSARVPELVEAVRTLPADSLILDGEALALDPAGRPQPFQITMKRFGRRLDVERMRRELPLNVFFFDCLHARGDDLIDEPGGARAEIAGELLPGELRVPRAVARSVAEGEAFLERALESGHEGILAKSLGAPYEAGRRGSEWLKIKPVQTLDLVVLAAEWGSGRRRGFLSNLHLGARDPKTNGFVMLGKTFKGLTDALLEWQTEQFLARELTRDAYTVYVKPELVVEIAFDSFQASSHYPGGLALRFARVKRYRPDKTAEQADTIDTVRGIYAAQSKSQES